MLLEICHKLNLKEPSYEIQNVGSEFTCCCTLNDLECKTLGEGKSKKLAKFDSAVKTV